LFIMDDNSQYYEVFAYLQGNSQPVKRFFLEDTTSVANKITVATSVKLSLDLDSNGNLINPSIYLSYTQLSLQTGVGITPSSAASQQLTFSVVYNYGLGNFWTGAIISFIVISLAALVHAIGKTYIGYLHRKTPLLFFLNLIGVWSLWMFYYLLFMSGYWFLFTKTAQNIYVLMPQTNQFYVAFFVLVGLMGLFRIICVIIDKADKLNIEVFIINW
ncbi:MAG: hypothetical protein ABL857_08780, partial [Rickettsiales bacterium]